MSNELGYEPTDVRVIGTFERYEDAQALVDRLARQVSPSSGSPSSAATCRWSSG